MWWFLGFCLYENVSYGYGFRDEASHYASCREDSGNSGLVPFHVMHNHDDRDEDENRGNPYPNHLCLDEDVVGEEAINSFNDCTPLDVEDTDCIIDDDNE